MAADDCGVLAFDQLLVRPVGIIDESDATAVLIQASVNEQPDSSKRSRGTWESQKPKNTTS